MPAARKRPPSGNLVDQVRGAIESRIPADWRKQAERQYKDLRKQFDKQVNATEKNLTAFRKQVDQRLNRVADRGELDKLAKRIEGLQKEIEKLARQATGGAAGTASRSRSAAARRTTPARRTAAAAKKAPVKRAPAKTAPAKKASAGGSAATTRRAAAATATTAARTTRTRTSRASRAAGAPPPKAPEKAPESTGSAESSPS